ncbi:HAD family hydrolase [Clostridium perfringens]
MLKKLIENNEVISFDIFDTLIKRNINRPTDIFGLVEVLYNKDNNKKINFKKDRILAERKARLCNSREDITLDDIYNNFKKDYNDSDLKELKELEKKIEVSMCIGNEKVIEAFNYAKSLNKKVIIVSDMYLTRDVIEDILNKNGVVGYDDIYISSEYGLTKHTGNLFKYVCDKNKFLADRMLHIGDNIGSDINQAKKFGINTFHIKESGEGTLSKKILNKIDDKFSKKDIYENIIDILVKYNSENKDYMYKYGYGVLGPILYGFLDYIHKDSIKKRVEHIYFFSRDGYLLKKAYDKYYFSDNKIESSYLYVSRKSLVTPMIKESDSIEEVFDKLGIKVPISVSSFFDRFLRDSSIMRPIVERYYESYNDILDINKEYQKVNNLYKDSKEILFKEIKKQRLLLEKYLIQENINKYNNIGIMDLGWRGSLQFNLINILNECKFNTSVFGYYLGLNNKFSKYEKYGMKADGYIFNPDNNFYENYVLGGVGLVELMFTAPHGSVLGYKKEEDKIKPILDEIEYSENQQKNINLIQEGALDFIRDISKLSNSINLEFDKEILIKKFINLISNPKLSEVKVFGDFSFYDYGESFLAKPSSIKEIILKPKKAIREFRKSNWKIGYMKRLLKLNVKYIKIYSAMRNIEIKK